jgi:hypothetical protein
VSNHLTEKTEEKIVEKFLGGMFHRLLLSAKRTASSGGSRRVRPVPGVALRWYPSLLFFVSVDSARIKVLSKQQFL